MKAENRRALMSSFSVFITDSRNSTATVVQDATPVLSAGVGRTNLSFESDIHETACAARGDIVRIAKKNNDVLFEGCLFPHSRHGGKRKLDWYSEIMLVSALINSDGTACSVFEAVVVFVDHMDRINDVRLVPRNGAIDDCDEDFDPEVVEASPATPKEPFSPRKRRIMAAFNDRAQLRGER